LWKILTHPGLRNYWKSNYLPGFFSDAAIDVLVDHYTTVCPAHACSD